MQINEWYDSKLKQFGKDDFRSLNWGDKEGKSAKARYQQMFEQYNWSNKKLLEVGCGWGSFFDFGFTCNEYCGIDINSNLIKETKYMIVEWNQKEDIKNFLEKNNINFKVVNLNSDVLLINNNL